MVEHLKQRILFVSHSADRSGAPLFLLNFLQWIRSHVPNAEFDILLKDGGEVSIEFAALGQTTFWTLDDSPIVSFLDRKKLWGRRRDRFVKQGILARRHQASILASISCREYDAVFVNSFAAAELIPLLGGVVSCPIICRAPELRSVVLDYCGLETVQRALPYCSRFVAVSNTVRDFMSGELSIPLEKISHIPGFFRPLENEPALRANVRKRLGLGDSAFVVCGCGTISWRKGTDLFVQIAAEVIRRLPSEEVAFLWIGGDVDSVFFNALSHDLHTLGLGQQIRFIGPTSNPHDYYGASDVLAMTSREDPFPLVVLEAASMGLPVVCFDGPIGSAEFVSAGAGEVVPYLATAEFAAALTFLRRNPESLLACATASRASVERYSYESISAELFTLIEREITHRCGAQ